MTALLLDVWSDRNRGDAAMQMALARLVRSAGASTVTVMTAFGYNQDAHLPGALDETAPLVDGIVGGFRLTRHPFGSMHPGTSKVGAVGLALLNLVLLPFWMLLARFRFPFAAHLPASLGRSAAAVQNSTVIVWNGRNFRGDSRFRECVEIFNIVYNPLIALASKTPVVCIGASFWPLRSALARRLLRHVLLRTDTLTVREFRSKQEVERLLGRAAGARAKVVPDLSFPEVLRAHDPRRDLRARVHMARVGLTIVDWSGNGSAVRARYLHVLRDTVQGLLSDPLVEVVIIPQVTVEKEETSSLLAELQSGQAGSRIRVLSGEPTVAALLSIYRELDVLIATRMHSAIFALSQGTPVVAIPYDHGGKWGILEMLGLALREDGSYHSITKESLSEQLDIAWRERERAEQIRSTMLELAGIVEREVIAIVKTSLRAPGVDLS